MFHAINSLIQVMIRSLVNKSGGSLCYQFRVNANISDGQCKRCVTLLCVCSARDTR